MSQESKGSPAKAADGFKLPVSGRLNLKFSSLESLVQRLGRHICQDGIFIPTGEPKPAGTLLALRILVQPDETIVEAEGEVLWTRRSHKPQEPTGMAFRFVHLNETGRNFVFRIAQMNREAGIPPAVVVEQTAKEPAAIADKVKQAATGPIIGIDFGTSNSSVAYMDPDRKFLFSLSTQEGTSLRPLVALLRSVSPWERVGGEVVEKRRRPAGEFQGPSRRPMWISILRTMDGLVSPGGRMPEATGPGP